MNGLAEKQDGLARKLVTNLIVGKTYTLENLANLLGVQPTAVQRKGVLTRAGSDAQLLLITLEKDKYHPQEYFDHLDDTTLFWSGQNRVRKVEKNIINATHDSFIFIQKKRRLPYFYYGRAIPIRTHISNEIDVPSRIIFDLPEYAGYREQVRKQNTTTNDFLVAEPHIQYRPKISLIVPETTDKEILYKVRTAQTQYRNNVLSFWDNQCAVTGVDDVKWLIASHIKPWRESTVSERIDPKNSLLLTPNYDKLFDRGVISFNPNDGKIILPEQLSMSMWSNLNKLNINEDIHLRKVPDGVDAFLDYHNKYVFNFEPSSTITNEELIEDLLVKGMA